MFVFEVNLVCIFPHSDWIQTNAEYLSFSVQMRENTNQNNSKYGHFLCSVANMLQNTLHELFALTCIYFLPYLFGNQWNVDKENTYMKMKRTFFGKNGEWCSHQRRIQKPGKRLRWIKLFAKIINGWKFINYFCKKFHLWCLAWFWMRLW